MLGAAGGAGGDLLVGAAEGDDAAVLRLDDERALVLTTDFFTPIVDDARDWGRIAAANALSDVYAMGGRPVVALNLTAWPGRRCRSTMLADVLRGGASVCASAGCLVVGGHTIDDPEPKYGMAVVGLAAPSRLLTIDAARPGDTLVLTKAIGTGVVATAHKRGAPPRRRAGGGGYVDDHVERRGERGGAGRGRGARPPTSPGSRCSATCTGCCAPAARARSCRPRRCRCCLARSTLTAAGYVSGGTRNNMSYLEPWVSIDACGARAEWRCCCRTRRRRAGCCSPRPRRSAAGRAGAARRARRGHRPGRGGGLAWAHRGPRVTPAYAGAGHAPTRAQSSRFMSYLSRFRGDVRALCRSRARGVTPRCHPGLHG